MIQMRNGFQLALVLAGLGLGTHSRANDPAGFEPYRTIVDRSPFGAVAAAESEVMPNFAERYVYTGNVPDVRSKRLLAIIFDTQANRSEMVPEGGPIDEAGEIKVIKIDPSKENSTVVIKRGLESATLRLQPPEKIAANVPTAPPTAATPGVVAVQPGETPAQPRRRIPFRRGSP